VQLLQRLDLYLKFQEDPVGALHDCTSHKAARDGLVFVQPYLPGASDRAVHGTASSPARWPTW